MRRSLLCVRRFCTVSEEKAVVPRQTFSPVNPATGQSMPAIFEEATADDVRDACNRASMAFPIYRSEPLEQRARFLETIASEIEGLGDKLIQTCMEETGLPQMRLNGERGRTTGQLRMFAEVVREGLFLDSTIDTPDSNRKPIPKPDLRMMNVPIGPVAVFGASNFPLAFSVAGGDTASALAAGNPVVVKGHPAHPYTSQLVSEAILRAVERCDLPKGTFEFLQGIDNEVGTRLVQEPAIQAVGFTGSYQAGRTLTDIASNRLQPIPVYAEMGSSNPFFILPGALGKPSQIHDIAKGLATSIMLGVGQFCTQPGLIFMQKDKGYDAFVELLAEEVANKVPETMLTKSIADNYNRRVEETILDTRYQLIAQSTLTGASGVAACAGPAALLQTTAREFLNDHTMEEEIFGPSSIIVLAENEKEMLQCAMKLGGHLTVTMHGTSDDFNTYPELVDFIQDKAGRVVFNGYPTGVEVCNAMIHGGPFPATTVPRSTSVGKKSIDRFLRPICFQNAPQAVLPDALQDENPLGIVRNIDGILTTEPMSEFLLKYASS